MSLTEKRDYKKVTGELEDDFNRINETFEKIAADVDALIKKDKENKEQITNELRAEMSETFALMANLSLKTLERTQKIKIGVET